MTTPLRVPVTDEDHIQGPRDAPLTLVEYGDYECPFCAQAFVVAQRVQKIFEDDLRFVFRNFPLTEMHPHALNAAQAAEAAALQGKFWEMHDMLYENQQSLDGESLSSYAADLRLNLRRFVEDLKNARVEKKIMEDMYGGARSGVNGTPTFFVNGYRFDGDWSSTSFLKVLEEARGLL